MDAATGRPLVDVVADAAEQKGTGRWTVQIALDLGVPVSGIAEAVFARSLSGHTEQRGPASALAGPTKDWNVGDIDSFVEDVRRALYASKVVAYAQGFDLIRTGSREYGWDIDLGSTATIWRGGCIIQARFLDRIRQAFDGDPELPTLLLDEWFGDRRPRRAGLVAARGRRCGDAPASRRRASPRRWRRTTACGATGCRPR